MFRLTAALLIAGCAHATPIAPDPLRAYGNPQNALVACLDLQDHIVSLYADEWLAENNEQLTPEEYRWFQQSWKDEVAKQGGFDRFDASCAASITPDKYSCGMRARTVDSALACVTKGG